MRGARRLRGSRRSCFWLSLAGRVSKRMVLGRSFAKRALTFIFSFILSLITQDTTITVHPGSMLKKGISLTIIFTTMRLGWYILFKKSRNISPAPKVNEMHMLMAIPIAVPNCGPKALASAPAAPPPSAHFAAAATAVAVLRLLSQHKYPPATAPSAPPPTGVIKNSPHPMAKVIHPMANWSASIKKAIPMKSTSLKLRNIPLLYPAFGGAVGQITARLAQG